MKTTKDVYSGRRFRYNEIVVYQGYHVPGRVTARVATHLAPGRVHPKLWEQLNPGIKQPQGGRAAA